MSAAAAMRIGLLDSPRTRIPMKNAPTAPMPLQMV
jgi:hypothetical protein